MARGEINHSQQRGWSQWEAGLCARREKQTTVRMSSRQAKPCRCRPVPDQTLAAPAVHTTVVGKARALTKKKPAGVAGQGSHVHMICGAMGLAATPNQVQDSLCRIRASASVTSLCCRCQRMLPISRRGNALAKKAPLVCAHSQAPMAYPLTLGWHGHTTLNKAPACAPRRTDTLPPCHSAMRWTIDRPRPYPPLARPRL